MSERSSDAKLNPLGPTAVEERLLADAVAGEEQTLAALVPEGEREHPVEMPDAVDPVLLVQVDDHLGVALGREAVAPLASSARSCSKL